MFGRWRRRKSWTEILAAHRGEEGNGILAPRVLAMKVLGYFKFRFQRK